MKEVRRRLASEELPPEGEGRVLFLENGQEVAIFCVEGQWYAIDNSCPHEGGPLGEGELEGDIVTCPWHGWQFNVKTGQGNNAYGEDVKRYPIEQTADGLFLLIPE